MVRPSQTLASRSGGKRRRSILPRATLGLLLGIALLALTSGPVAFADDLSANLSCDDGTNLNLSLDLTSLQSLEDAVQATVDYPAGLTCSVAQLPSLSTGIAFRFAHSLIQNAFADSGNPHYDYAVGGGQAMIVHRCLVEETNFGLSAHVFPDLLTTGIGGTVNFTIPQCPVNTVTGVSYGASHLGMKVDCLQVSESGTVADLTAAVTQKTGLFADSAGEFPVPLNEIAVEVVDNSLTGDRTGWEFQDNANPGTAVRPCDFFATADSPVDHGHINVHEAD